MRITVLQKPVRVKNYLYYGIILFLIGFQSAYAAQDERTTQQEKTAAAQQSQPQQSPVLNPSPSQTAVEQPQPAVETEKRLEQQKTALWDVKFTDWLQVGINAVLLIVVFWQAGINRQQRMTMHKQNEIMEGQNRIMQGELDAMQTSMQHAERALLASEAQAEAAKQSVLIAKESFYVGERPYFGIKAIGFQVTNLIPRIEIKFENGGRTPAWHFRALVWVIVGDSPDSETRWNLNLLEPRYADRYIPAGSEVTFVFTRPDVRFIEEQYKAISAGDVMMFVAGTAHYKDMRNDKLHHNFTALWHPKSNRFTDWEA